MKNLKAMIYIHLQKNLDQKIQTARSAMQSAEESKNNETKSSAGDKYETGRAMMQMEQDKNEAQLMKLVTLKRELAQINLQKEYDKVELGSLVMTNQGNYYIAIGIGKIVVDQETCYAISLASPIGRLLHGKRQGDSVKFQDKVFEIEKIV